LDRELSVESLGPTALTFNDKSDHFVDGEDPTALRLKMSYFSLVGAAAKAFAWLFDAPRQDLSRSVFVRASKLSSIYYISTF
jgi:hypothetical protein